MVDGGKGIKTTEIGKRRWERVKKGKCGENMHVIRYLFTTILGHIVSI